jgi:hypothetical protein
MKNYTSTVPAERSVEEIERMLVRGGARSISKEYVDGEVSALNFMILCHETNAPLGVRLPADCEAVFQVLKKARSPRARSSRGYEPRLREQSKRTAWRLMFDWVAVQLSLIEMKQAELMQVFLPYLWTGKTTFYESIKQDKFRAIGYTGSPSEEETEH